MCLSQRLKTQTDKKEAFKLSKRLNLSKVIRSGKAKRGSESDGNGEFKKFEELKAVDTVGIYSK